MKRIKGERCRLSDIRVGQICNILYLEIKESELKKHLLEMGLIPQTIVKVKKKAPFRRPDSYRVKRL